VTTIHGNDLGNLTSRTLTMVHKYCDGLAPAAWDPSSLQDPTARAALDALIVAATGASVEVAEAYEEFRLHDALEAAWYPVVRANEFIERVKPWAVAKDPARRTELSTTLRALLETLRITARLAWPAIPGKCEELWSMLRLPGTPGEMRDAAAAARFGPGEPAGEKLAEVKSLFPRLEAPTDAQT
jgi:methionyl-tRNA synthetase